ncbi:type I glyceraldehyde-3-phosphate dehydrogenase [Candidatus Peregrinibacteria bacterium CG_4_10_14_0_2_um_filter_43_11]|nr:MAG: type I glyceraldehyde-3-phosphate dehydrogenase [Candidatus Peregrinibacteria bacterium CG_4_10_14_0_2_um_filter_43_11]
MKIAINGFGRIGRQTLHIIMQKHNNLEVVAINDLTDNTTLAHLFAFDSTYGRYPGTVELQGNDLVVDGKKIHIYAESDPEKLPWKELGVDVVLECTGVFRTHEGAGKHITAGAKRVIISAPAKGDKGADVNIVMGVNEETYNPETHFIISNASCTTNCLAPVAKVLNDEFGIKRGLMTTIHAVTNDQRILDLPHKDLRRARSCIQSMIPTTTGAAKAVGLVIPELQGKLSGMSIRVPLPTTSVVDLTVELKKSTTAEEINAALKKRAKEIPEILEVEDRPLVSKDFQKDSHSSIVDAQSTMVIDGTFVKVLAWYDNEWGYSCRLVDLTQYITSA